MNCDPSKSNFHTENVQFCADSLRSSPRDGLSEPGDSQKHVENVHFYAAPDPHPLPAEPAPDYQLFLAWLQLPHPRKFRAAATTLKCSFYRLRRLAAKYHWKPRAAEFDDARANASRRAFQQMLQDENLNWRQRAERFRLQEWLLSEQMLVAAHAAAEQCHKHPGRIRLHHMIKLFELGSLLGRRAAGMPIDGKEPPKPEGLPPGCIGFEEALAKVYGNRPAPPEGEDRRNDGMGANIERPTQDFERSR